MAFTQMLDSVSRGSVLSVMALSALALYLWTSHRKLAHIPTVGGSSLPVLSYAGAVRYLLNANAILGEGCARDRLFKVALMDRWLVIVPNVKITAELAALPEDVMSSYVATNELLEADYTLGSELLGDAHHHGTISRNLSKNLNDIFPAMKEETCAALDEYIPATDDWTAVPANDTAMLVIARTSNRVFTGLPLCRDRDFLDLNINFTIRVIIDGFIIGMLPQFLKPLVGRYITQVPKSIKQAMKLLSPEIARRREMMRQREYDEIKSNDLLTWLMDDVAGNPVRDTDRDLSLRILGANFAALHTTANIFTHALFTLAAHPDWAQAIREEIEPIVENEGLTKASLVKMHKLDSFLRETGRTRPIPGQVISRVAVKPFVFSDGTAVPAGTMITVPMSIRGYDESMVPNAAAFDPFRFEQPFAEDGARKQFTSLDLAYLIFGYGKHTCPGRFFAGMEIKTMFVHLLLKYDMRTEVEGERPKDTVVACNVIPNPKAKVLFRQRPDYI